MVVVMDLNGREWTCWVALACGGALGVLMHGSR
jgi:hypothetical protein